MFVGFFFTKLNYHLDIYESCLISDAVAMVTHLRLAMAILLHQMVSNATLMTCAMIAATDHATDTCRTPKTSSSSTSTSTGNRSSNAVVAVLMPMLFNV